MENNVKKSLFASFGFKLFMIVTFTIITSGALTYGFLYADKRQSGESSIATTCFDVSFEEGESISLQNAYSMSDASGQRTTPYTFSVTNNCEKETSYTVILSTTIGSIDSKFINTSLNGESASELASLIKNRSYEVGEGFGDSFILSTGSLKKDETANFDLRVWINSIATYDDVKGASWEGEVKIISGIKEIEDMKTISNKLKIIARQDKPDFTKLNRGSEVYILDDDDGESYYYRGTAVNNHMYFAGMYWQIVRLNGDGSLRLAYDGETLQSNGDGSSRMAINSVVPLIEGNEDNLNSKLSEWYQNKIVAKEYDRYISSTTFCNDSKETVGNPTFKCKNKIVNKIGLLSLDEVVAGGAIQDVENSDFYLYRNEDFWLSNGRDVDNKYILDENGKLVLSDITSPSGVVPVINISKEYLNMIIGSGTIDDPYSL